MPESRSSDVPNPNTREAPDPYEDVLSQLATGRRGETVENGWCSPRRPGGVSAWDSIDTPPDLAVDPPSQPDSLRAAGLTLAQVTDLILKLLYLHGALTGFDIAAELKLPFRVAEEGLRFLKEQRCAEVTSGDMLGQISQRFVLTDLGRIRARDAFEQCRYVGPAPVSLADYTEQCRRQSVVGIECTADDLAAAFEGLVIREGLLEELGPAVCSGRSIFLHGPPGNGKTVIAKGLGRFLNTRGGDIFVPYAVQVDGAIITVFDPAVHQSVRSGDSEVPGNGDGAVEELEWDLRWRRVHRPVIVTGGELTLEMLDLRHSRTGQYYTAPPHVKANGGAFLVDDFGRQIVRPKELLNRWILPLEERSDHLTLTTGRKITVPFEQLTIFSTNLEPHSLVDEAFLRRMRHKILIGPPSREVFEEILRRTCAAQQVEFPPDAVEYLFSRHYNRQRSPKACDPRDLMEIAGAICRFRGERAHLGEPVLAEAAQRLFCEV